MRFSQLWTLKADIPRFDKKNITDSSIKACSPHQSNSVPGLDQLKCQFITRDKKSDFKRERIKVQLKPVHKGQARYRRKVAVMSSWSFWEITPRIFS